MRNGITDAEGHGPQQQVHRPVPGFGFDLGDAPAGAARPGIVEQRIDAAGFLRRMVHQRLDRRVHTLRHVNPPVRLRVVHD